MTNLDTLDSVSYKSRRTLPAISCIYFIALSENSWQKWRIGGLDIRRMSCIIRTYRRHTKGRMGMAITVKLNDATVRLGGNFNEALSFVKSFAGRTFDGQSKAWNVPVTLLAFQKQNGFPMDVLASANAAREGQHITRYGNKYSSVEWQAKKDVEAIRIPSEIAQRCEAKIATAEADFLSATGMNAQQAAQVRGLWHRFGGDLDDAERCGKIKFSSPARKAQIISAMDAWVNAEMKADDEAEDYRASEERRIMESIGY